MTALFDAVADVVAQERIEQNAELMARAVSKFVEIQVNDPELLTKLAGLMVDEEKIGLLASTGIFRCIIRGKYESGPAYIYGLEFILFVVLGVCKTE